MTVPLRGRDRNRLKASPQPPAGDMRPDVPGRRSKVLEISYGAMPPLHLDQYKPVPHATLVSLQG